MASSAAPKSPPIDEEDMNVIYPPIREVDDSTLPLHVPSWQPSRRHKSGSLLSNIRSAFFASRPLTRYLILFLMIIAPTYWLFIYVQDYVAPGRRPPPFGFEPPTHVGAGHSELWSSRAEDVKKAYLHAYRNYEQYAYPYDELLPLTKSRVNNFNGWAVSTVDSLDTMLMMGLTEEYKRGLKAVEKLDIKNHDDFIPFFETTIRYFGGLLGAYAQTKDQILLTKVDELAIALMPVFNTTSGLPRFSVNPKTGQSKVYWGEQLTIFADAGTCQMEYKYLAHLTGNKEYFLKADHIVNLVKAGQDRRTGLISIFHNLKTGGPEGQHFSIGALADSGYEYLLKGYLLSGKSETKLKDMYLATVGGIIDNLLYLSPSRHLLYVTDIDNGHPSHTFEHLSCFLPGLFALGAISLPLSPAEKQLHIWIASGLAQTCWLTYMDQATGLGPDEMSFDPSSTKWIHAYREWEKMADTGTSGLQRPDFPPGVGGEPMFISDSAKRDYTNKRTEYLLRPETVESLFILWRATGEQKWRERGYDIFRAIERNTRVENGYACVSNTDQTPPKHQNSMPSYFLAETLKYLYLLFHDGDGGYPLDKYVFNTEAHPLPVFEWSAAEKAAYQI